MEQIFGDEFITGFSITNDTLGRRARKPNVKEKIEEIFFEREAAKLGPEEKRVKVDFKVPEKEIRKILSK